MQTHLSKDILATEQGREADSILRACVHCGFCTATCPTYQLLGDELDSPRGRIYLMKEMLEGAVVTVKTMQHLDRCLSCRSCETTCPSGVRYGRLLDIGRELINGKVSRGPVEAMKRLVLRKLLPYPARFGILLMLAHWMKPLLPGVLRQKIPVKQDHSAWPGKRHERSMLVLQGCVQSVSTPETNAATARVLDHAGIELLAADNAGCCGAASYHLAATREALDFMRKNIDAWWPHVEQGIEAIVITASGCGVMVKDYGELLRHDDTYREKAEKISALAKDVSEVIANERLHFKQSMTGFQRVAFHSPCTLQHGQKITGKVESILERAGYELTTVKDSHLCCGSAGTYSILQPGLSQQLLSGKLVCLQENEPDVIATANIGCQLHLASRAGKPVKHWIELLAGRL